MATDLFSRTIQKQGATLRHEAVSPLIGIGARSISRADSFAQFGNAGARLRADVQESLEVHRISSLPHDCRAQPCGQRFRGGIV
jgi:hypothetical protein